ncbi:MAG: DUF3015 family protein [Nitrospirota bacterium]
MSTLRLCTHSRFAPHPRRLYDECHRRVDEGAVRRDDATTQLTNGTSGATKEFLDPTTEFTSSTTPGALADGRLLRARQKATVFAMHTHENLRADIARGQGEYLASLASLTGVSTDQWTDLQDRMRNAYPDLFNEQISPAHSSERIVEIAWAHGYGVQAPVDR